MKRGAGFTLLELLIAVAIFALIGAMAFGGLQQVLDQQHGTARQAQRLTDLQTAYRIMQRDIEQIANRDIRNQFGDELGALVGGSGFDGMAFSRAGYANPAGFLRSDIQRIAYVPDQAQLLRRTWRVLDRAQDSEPNDQVLVEGLRRFVVRFLDASGEWQEQWPPTSTTVAAPLGQGFPRAVEVLLELDDVGTLSWLFRMPDNALATTPAAPGTEAADDAQQEGDDRQGSDVQDSGDSDTGEQPDAGETGQ